MIKATLMFDIVYTTYHQVHVVRALLDLIPFRKRALWLWAFFGEKESRFPRMKILKWPKYSLIYVWIHIHMVKSVELKQYQWENWEKMERFKSVSWANYVNLEPCNSNGAPIVQKWHHFSSSSYLFIYFSKTHTSLCQFKSKWCESWCVWWAIFF